MGKKKGGKNKQAAAGAKPAGETGAQLDSPATGSAGVSAELPVESRPTSRRRIPLEASAASQESSSSPQPGASFIPQSEANFPPLQLGGNTPFQSGGSTSSHDSGSTQRSTPRQKGGPKPQQVAASTPRKWASPTTTPEGGSTPRQAGDLTLREGSTAPAVQVQSPRATASVVSPMKRVSESDLLSASHAPPHSQGNIAQQMGDMNIVSKVGMGLTIPPRKSPTSCGTMGRRTEVDTNHLLLDLSKLSPEVIHYDVHIDPDKPKRLLRPAMREFQNKFYPNRSPAFDGKKNLYSSKLLPFGLSTRKEIVVFDAEREREKEFVITIRQVGTINMGPLIKGVMGSVQQSALQALDIILRNAPANSMVPVGRSFFSKPEGQALDLGDGMEAWIGFFQSAIIGWKPFVNIDVAHKGFPKQQSCVGVISDLFRDIKLNQELNPYQKDDFMKYIRELKVDYVVPGQPNTKRTYRVNGIGKSSRAQEFTLDDGRTTTVEEYYLRTKKYRIQYPFLPCLDVGSPKREKKILVPCELCTLVGGQVVIKKMTEIQTSRLIKIAATDTDDRKRKIMSAMRKCNFNADPSVKEFGLRVNDTFQRVPARVLDPPKLMYKDKNGAGTITPKCGVWRASQFHDGKSLKHWTILSMDKWAKDDMLRAFAQGLEKQAQQVGMVIEPPQEPIYTKINLNEVSKLQEFLNRNKHLQLIFVVVQDSGISYAKVKQMAELTVGVLTQCLKLRTLNRMNPATIGNILLKVNAKLNGVNHTFGAVSKPNCLKVPCMIVGADVTHPPPDQNSMPSVAAVCASHEPKAFKYNIQYRLQPPRMEIIQDLENIMKQQLQFFFQSAKCKPKKIIFYRDGVSEGQFQEVLNVEFQAIRRACQSVSSDDPEYKPQITFLVVQKRHHTRFFPTSTRPEDCDGRNKNVPAGTIVDTIITHPTDLDFYLVSHASIQGVSRPTKYRRLWDDNNMSEDELEQLTYYLCHMFTRCTRSVSYPAPTYYAHLAAYRARCYLEGMRITMTNLPHEQDLRKIKDEIIRDSPMFFV